MTDRITIPPEALEAAAREEYEFDRAASLDEYPPWEELSERMRNWRVKRMEAACLAMLSAWPGMHLDGARLDAEEQAFIILPLPQENTND